MYSVEQTHRVSDRRRNEDTSNLTGLTLVTRPNVPLYVLIQRWPPESFQQSGPDRELSSVSHLVVS